MTAFVDAAAAELLGAYDTRGTLSPFTRRPAGLDMATGYQVCHRVHELRCARGEHPAGRKIGFTNRNIWAEYHVDSPIWAHVYDTTVHDAPDGQATIPVARMVSPRIEPEIAFGLRAGLAAGQRDPAAILTAIEWVAPSFELVDCHYPGWSFTSADSVADLAFHAALVVGPRTAITAADRADWARRLAACTVTLLRDGQPADTGTGANALGHPALALAFLADVLASQSWSAPLAAGEVVTTGTLTAALPVARGETWTSAFEGIGLPRLALTLA